MSPLILGNHKSSRN